MALATATGAIAGPMDRLKTAFVATPTWASFSGGAENFYFDFIDAPTAAEQLTRLEANSTRPFVFMYPDYPQGLVIVADATDGSRKHGGTIQCVLEKEANTVGAFATTEELWRLWDNMVGVMLCELFETAYNEGLIDIARIDSVMLSAPDKARQLGKGDFVKASFKVTWGRL